MVEVGLLEVGHVVKPHGLTGEVVVELSSNREERRQTGSVFSSGRGELRVERCRAASGRRHRFIMRLSGVTDLESAERLRGVALFAPAIEDPEALWVHELVGAQVLTIGGQHLGTVVGVVANPASDLLELDGGVLIPLTFVVDHEPGRVTVDPPPGLVG